MVAQTRTHYEIARILSKKWLLYDKSNSAPLQVLLSSSCGGLQQKGHSGPNMILLDRQNDDLPFIVCPI